jgi:hypothetical protein
LLGELLDVGGIYGTLFSPCPLFLHSRRLVDCRSSHQRSLIEIKNIGLRGSNFRVD